MKEQSIKLSEYFKIIKPKYKYIQVIPHKSLRNNTSSNIAKAIAHTYKAINKRIRIESKKLIVEASFKISYIIDIKNNNANFYFLVPIQYTNIIIEKIKEIWGKATIKEVELIEPISLESDLYQLSYKKEDAMSLIVDKKSNEPLNSILSTMDIMKDDDRITIVYNFMPNSQLGWLDRYNSTIDKIKDSKSILKRQVSTEYIIRAGILGIVGLLDGFLGVLNDFLGGKSTDDKNSLYKSILGVLEQQKELSPATKKKKEQTILNTQIGVYSYSKDDTRRDNNALGVCQSYRVLDDDNELIYKKVKTKSRDIEEYDIKTEVNTSSTDEISNFIQLPGRMLLKQFGIKHINIEENLVPKILQEGYLSLGTNTFRGNEVKAYIENEYNQGNLPLVLIGSQGSGKSEYIKNIAKNCIDNKEGVIILDFIKSCNLSDSVAKITPKDKLIKLNLANEKDIQGLGYNEMKIEGGMSSFRKLDLASMQTQQIMNLVDAISIGDPLSSRMRRYLSSASKVVFCQGYNSLKDVINCLENHNKRKDFINGLEKDLKSYLEDELNTLEELNEYSKASKENQMREVIGTNSSKIEHILDRVSMLREDFKMKYMYDKNCGDNINLIDAMEKGKVVIIQMKEDDFPTKMIKNILITYWISKVWLTSQIRGGMSDKPLRTNFIIDEIFQAPTSLNMMSYIIPQSRKFGLHTILSTQYIKQLDTVFESLEASGSSFMLLKGANEDDFNHFKNKLEGFEYEDLRDMEQYHSLNLINYCNGYASFITKLPKPI